MIPNIHRGDFKSNIHAFSDTEVFEQSAIEDVQVRSDDHTAATGAELASGGRREGGSAARGSAAGGGMSSTLGGRLVEELHQTRRKETHKHRHGRKRKPAQVVGFPC